MWEVSHIGRERCEIALEKIPTKQRPRFDTRSGRTYTPTKTEKAEKAIKSAWRKQVGHRWMNHSGEVRVMILIERPLSKSNPKYWAGKADVMMPDCDNVAKLCCDALNGVAYADDRQVTQLHVIRLPRVPFRKHCRIRIRIDYYEETYLKERR